jgi:hypothetical protein
VGHPAGDRKRWRFTAGAVLVALAACGAPAAAGAAVNPLIAGARLDGQFLLAGRITKATNVRGEHKGQTVSRTWTFASTCATGPCATLDLTRTRQTGTDRIVLALTNGGSYKGTGSFYAPLRCGGRTYNRGELVPFTVSVTVSAAVRTDLGIYATRVTATYSNRLRINRTRCVTSPSNEAVAYHGHLVPASTSGGAPLSGRSPAGS